MNSTQVASEPVQHIAVTPGLNARGDKAVVVFGKYDVMH